MRNWILRRASVHSLSCKRTPSHCPVESLYLPVPVLYNSSYCRSLPVVPSQALPSLGLLQRDSRRCCALRNASSALSLQRRAIFGLFGWRANLPTRGLQLTRGHVRTRGPRSECSVSHVLSCLGGSFLFSSVIHLVASWRHRILPLYCLPASSPLTLFNGRDTSSQRNIQGELRQGQ